MRIRGAGLAAMAFLVAVIIFRPPAGNERFSVPDPPADRLKSRQIWLQQARSAEGSKDDPEARLNYRNRMLADPATGEIPRGILRRERLFVRKIPAVSRGEGRENARKNASETWVPVGPDNVGGRTRALALDILDEQVIMAGAVSGGMWRSEDGGITWILTTNPLSLHSVTAIAQDVRPGKEHVWYYGTGEIVGNSAGRNGAPYRGDGLFKSVDGGKTWQPVWTTVSGTPNHFNNQFQYIFRILINKFNQVTDEIYVGAVGAVFRSTNGGLSWKAVLGRDVRNHPNYDLNKSSLSRYTDICLAANGIYYAVLSFKGFQRSSPDFGVYASTDGESWQNITPVIWPGAFARTVIGASPSDPSVVYFLTDAGHAALFRYDFKGVIKGQIQGDWTNLSGNLPEFGGEVGDFNTQGSYDMLVEVHPLDREVVYLGGTNLYRSEDGFATDQFIHWIGGYDTANDISKYPNHFVDQHALVFYRSDPDRILSSNDGGIYRTSDGRARQVSWHPLNNGYRTGQFYTLAVDEYGGAKQVMGGMMDNGIYVAENPAKNAPWNRLLDGDGAYCSITRGGSYFYASTQNGRIIRLTLNKQLDFITFTRIDPLGGEATGPGYLFINPFVLAPENQNVMYLAAGDKIWRNLNLSQIPEYSNAKAQANWEGLEATTITKGQISAVEVSTIPTGVVYYGTSSGEVFRIDSANTGNYTVTSITSSFFPQNAYVSSIAVDKRDGDRVMVVFSNYNVLSIFSSVDGGLHFTSVSGNLEENPDGSGSGPSVRWVTIVPVKGGESKYYAGTSTGLFSTEALRGSQTAWEREGPEEIGNVVVTMIKNRPSDGALYVATHGNGVYKTAVPDAELVMPEPGEGAISLGPVYPNPFHEQLHIPFEIPSDGTVRITIYTATGQLIRTLLWATQFAGKNIAVWDGLNEAGYPVNRGLYLCQMEYADKRLSEKIIYY